MRCSEGEHTSKWVRPGLNSLWVTKKTRGCGWKIARKAVYSEKKWHCGTALCFKFATGLKTEKKRLDLVFFLKRQVKITRQRRKKTRERSPCDSLQSCSLQKNNLRGGGTSRSAVMQLYRPAPSVPINRETGSSQAAILAPQQPCFIGKHLTPEPEVVAVFRTPISERQWHTHIIRTPLHWLIRPPNLQNFLPSLSDDDVSCGSFRPLRACDWWFAQVKTLPQCVWFRDASGCLSQADR